MVELFTENIESFRLKLEALSLRRHDIKLNFK